MFSGIGGFELGLQLAAEDLGIDVECVGYSEIDKHSIATYEEHFQHDNYGDATAIDADALPDFQLLTAGFPCQAFSIAGQRRGFEETRGTLFFDIARVIQAKVPEAFILENVRGLLSHNKGQTFRVILRTLDELGYELQWKVLNSRDYGVPQSRPRLYVVGNLGGTPRPPVLPRAGSRNPARSINLTAEAAVTRTLTAGGKSGGNHSGMTVLRTPQGDRRLTNIEWERLQGFPDNWTVGSDAKRFRQTGDAGTVPLVAAIAKPVLTTLTSSPYH